MAHLQLTELAAEWQELLDELDPEAHDLPLTDAERDDLKADCTKYEDLCSELGISPVEPDTLRWYDGQHGSEFIPEDEFEDYARELAEEVDGIETSRWPYTCIDWSRAADELRMDYSTITYDGEDYYTR